MKSKDDKYDRNDLKYATNEYINDFLKSTKNILVYQKIFQNLIINPDKNKKQIRRKKNTLEDIDALYDG